MIAFARRAPPTGRWRAAGLAMLALVTCGAAWGAVPAHARAKRLYVRAAAHSGGSGSRRAPFRSLTAVEAASRPGDTIVVLPSPPTVPPLDGGIALKRRQILVGAGPSVAGASPRVDAPRIANSRGQTHSGDAVVLADRATVRNLVIGPSFRGAVYGSDVTGVTIAANDVSKQNTSCTVGFVVAPFVLPTVVPGAGVPISTGLTNGWAAVMLDESRVTGRITIARNVVHDADCGDGIDIRLKGTARVRAALTGNRVTRLAQGSELQSLLAIGMQTLDRSALEARLDDNTQTDIGSIGGRQTDTGAGLPGAGADSEGVFANLAGSSRLTAEIERNTWRHGIGGFSVNGMEMVISSGNPTASMRIADSSFVDGPGDLLEEINFGTNASMSLELDHVIARHSTGVGNTYAIPGNNGDCLVAGATGAGDSVALRMRHSRLSDCMNNGLTVASGVSNGSEGPVRSLSFDIDDSTISANRGYNLRVVTETELTSLAGKVQDTDLSGARQIGVAFDQLAGTTDRAVLDFGGGALGSAGRNCVFGAGALDAEALGHRASMRSNWWGRPGGPGAGRVIAAGGGLDTGAALAAPPAGVC